MWWVRREGRAVVPARMWVDLIPARAEWWARRPITGGRSPSSFIRSPGLFHGPAGDRTPVVGGRHGGTTSSGYIWFEVE